MITIKGKGFLPTGNTVMTTYGDSVTNLASADGQTLSFVFVFPAEVFRDEDNGGAISYPGNLKLSVNVWVITKNGRSNYLTYDLQI